MQIPQCKNSFDWMNCFLFFSTWYIQRTLGLNILLFLVWFLEVKLVFICNNYLWLGEGNGSPLEYSCLENPMDGGV